MGNDKRREPRAARGPRCHAMDTRLKGVKSHGSWQQLCSCALALVRARATFRASSAPARTSLMHWRDAAVAYREDRTAKRMTDMMIAMG